MNHACLKYYASIIYTNMLSGALKTENSRCIILFIYIITALVFVIKKDCITSPRDPYRLTGVL